MDLKKALPIFILIFGVLALGGLGAAIFLTRRKPISCNSNFLFVGDSNTVISHSYAAQLKQYCPGAHITILAKSGRNTNEMLDTLKTNLSGGNKYDVIAILGGSNDLGSNIDTIVNLDAMYKMAKASGARVVAVTPPSKNWINSFGDNNWGGSNYQTLLTKLKGITSWILGNKTADVIIDWNHITDKKEYFAQDPEHMHANGAAHTLLLDQMINKLPIKQA